MATGDTISDHGLERFLDTEGTGFTDPETVQGRAFILLANSLHERVEAFFGGRLDRMKDPFDRVVCRYVLMMSAIGRNNDLEAGAELAAAQVDDLLEAGEPESAAREAVTAATLWRWAGLLKGSPELHDKALETLSRGYDCLWVGEESPEDFGIRELTVLQGEVRRLLDNVQAAYETG